MAKIISNLQVEGNVQMDTMANATVNTNHFVVSDGGMLKYRTGAQLRSDIGAGTGSGSVTSITVTGSNGLSGTGTITSSGTITLSNSDRGSSQAIYKNIVADSGGTATANSNNDTLTITGGKNVSTVRSGDTITINATDTDTNNYVSSVSFNTSNGILTLNRSGLSALTVDLDGKYVDLTSNQTVAGDKIFTGTTTLKNAYQAYHQVATGDYYYDSYDGSKNLRWLVQGAKSDIIRYQSYSNTEYWNGSSWVSWTQTTMFNNILDGQKSTSSGSSITNTTKKFRFEVQSNTGWPTTAILWVETSWTGAAWPGLNVEIEEWDTATSSWSTNPGANAAFTSANGVTNWGLMGHVVTSLHTGDSLTRITLDFGAMPTSGGYQTVPLLNVMITSNFSGLDNTVFPFTVDYNKNLTTTGNFYGAGGNSTEWNTAYDNSVTALAVTGTTTKTLTATQQDGGTLTTSWADVNTDTNNYVSAVAFNTTNGILTLSRSGLAALTVDLDGRYLTSASNYYLDGISKSGNTLTFSVSGTTNQTYTFGGNAFNSTTIYAEPGIYSGGGTPTLASGVTGAEVRSLIGAGTSSLVIGTTASTAMAGNTTTITSQQATDIANNNKKVTDSGVPAVTSDGSTPALNTGISAAEMRSLIGAGTGSSNLVLGTTSTTAKRGDTTTITSTQASNILTNNAKVSDTGTPAVLSNGTTPSLNSGISASEMRSLIGAGTSSLTIGTTSSTAKAGNITTITGAQATAITNNSAKVSDTGIPAILSNGTTPTLNSGISAAEVRSLIGAGTSSSAGVTSVSGTANRISVTAGATPIVNAITGAVSSSSANLATGAQIQTAINSAVTGVLKYKGTWDAAANSPALISAKGTVGEYYIVSKAGSTNLDGITDWAVGDWAVFSDQATDAWQKIDNTQVGNVTGSGSSGRVAYWNGSTNVTSDAGLTFNGSTNALTVGGAVTWSGGSSAESNSAYDNMITGFSDSGSSTKTLTLTQQDGGTLTTSFSIPQGTTTPSSTETFTNKSGAISQWTNDSGYKTTDNNTTYTAGSGLSLVGTEFANTAPNIVQTTVSGNAGSATKLLNARTIAGVSFNGTANIALDNSNITNGAGYTTNTGTTTASNSQTFTNKGGNISQWTNDSGYVTSSGGSMSSWILKEGNGTEASTVTNGETVTFAQGNGIETELTSTTSGGTLTITNTKPNIVQTTITGNAGSATVLQTARTISGASFDGSANITLDNRNITNGAGYTTNTGDITSVGAGTFLTGGGTSGAVTLNVSATSAATASTLVSRDSAADISARLFRANYANQSTISGAIAFRVNNGTDNYLRYCSSPSAIRAFIGAGTGSGTSNLVIGTTSTTAMAGNTTTISSTQAANIVTNNAKVSNIVQTTVSGNAGSATKLLNARKIAGVSFDGTADIALDNANITNGAKYITSYVNTTYTAGTGLTLVGTQFRNTITNNNQLTNGASYLTTSGKAADSNLLDGLDLATGRNNVANQVVRTNSSGYIEAGWINTTSGNTTAAITDIYVNTNDGYIRKATAAQFRKLITDPYYTNSTGDITGVTAGTGMSGGGTSGTVTLNCTIDSPAEVGLGNLSSNGNVVAGDFTVGGSLYVPSAIYHTGDTNTYMQFHAADEWRVVTGGVERLEVNNTQVSVTGNFVASGNVTAYSDERLKSNIETIPNALEKVNALRGVTFDKDGKRGLGVIAQEVEKVLPEVVLEGEEYKSVAYGNIVGVLIEAVKELTKEVEDLKKQLK